MINPPDTIHLIFGIRPRCSEIDDFSIPSDQPQKVKTMERLEYDELTGRICDPNLTDLNRTKVSYESLGMPQLITFQNTGELEQLILKNAPKDAKGYTLSSSKEIMKGVDCEITGEYELFNVIGVQYFRKYLIGFLD